MRFEPYDRLIATGHRVDPKNYALVYSAELTPGTSLEDIYTRFNIDHPKDFKGHSLSVSDVVVLHQNGQDTAHYVDSFGYKDVPEFFKEQEKALIPDDLETGETIKTPRGTFYVTAMSREQMEAAGYGLHHQSDDGKYLIMGNGTRAFAVPVQPENYLKAAEQTTEQNYNMIDGQINNTPTTAEREAKVKAGETISLVDLAEAVKIYTRFNIDHPKDFKGHSLSVSDVVVLHQNGQDTAHYVDSFGYKEVPEFFKEQEKALIPDDLETGETIKTPRGTFYVTAMSREQMEAARY